MRMLIPICATALLLSACAKTELEPESFMPGLARVTDVWQTARTIHPAWHKLYPICLTDGESFILFHPEANGEWSVADRGKVNMELPKGIQAAFPMPFHNYEMACVLDVKRFASLEDMTVVFHEFVHCYQMEICDAELKANLLVAQENKHTNGMWELMYPFPYDKGEIGESYLQMIDAADRGDREAVVALRAKIRDSVSRQDWEYLTWQEFKEGTARWLQNVLAARIGARPARSSRTLPIDRVTLYEGGERVILLLNEENPELGTHFPALWQAIYEL